MLREDFVAKVLRHKAAGGLMSEKDIRDRIHRHADRAVVVVMSLFAADCIVKIRMRILYQTEEEIKNGNK